MKVKKLSLALFMAGEVQVICCGGFPFRERIRFFWIPGRNIFSALVSVVFLCVAMPVLAESQDDQAAAAPVESVVAVQEGRLKGLVTDHREFRGIPYAAAPTGDLRFRAPHPPAAWSGVRDATRFGSACPQAGRFGSSRSIDEDCLRLNIYTPAQGANLPVMVWIHGGGFTSGTANTFTASTLAKKGEVIVVTINYRLGVLGLLATPGLASEAADGAAGNFALLDQQAALHWVKANIAAFGGNPDNVTLFGESVGGSAVCAHLIAPGSKGLFHKAIVQSGYCNKTIASRDVNYRAAKAFAISAQCANEDPAKELACLRALPTDRIITLQGADSFATNDAKWQLNLDGSTLKASFAESVRSGQFNRVPVIAGSNHVEGYGFSYMGFKMAGKHMSAEHYQELIGGSLFNSSAEKVLAEYPPSNYPSAIDAYSAVLGDSVFSCDTRSMIRDLAGQGASVYAYEFRDPNPPTIPNVSLGPTHGAEMMYVFQARLAISDPSAFTPRQLQLSDQMLAYWTNFARKGDPNADHLPRWNIYSIKDDRFFGLTSEPPGNADVSGFSAEHHCDFWQKTYQ